MRYAPATQVPGPSEKTGYPGTAFNEGRGVVCHSMVGYRAGAMIELNNLDRRASWHFSVLQSGEVLQHYDPAQVTWHCGSPRWNARLIGIEHEGGFNPEDEPLTDLQLEASVKLVHWLSQTLGFPLERKVALWEHNEVAPPSDATSCPSNRIPWDAYTEERMYSDAEIDAKIGAVLEAVVASNTKIDALQASTDYLIKIVNNLAPRVDSIESFQHAHVLGTTNTP